MVHRVAGRARRSSAALRLVRGAGAAALGDLRIIIGGRVLFVADEVAVVFVDALPLFFGQRAGLFDIPLAALGGVGGRFAFERAVIVRLFGRFRFGCDALERMLARPARGCFLCDDGGLGCRLFCGRFFFHGFCFLFRLDFFCRCGRGGFFLRFRFGGAHRLQRVFARPACEHGLLRLFGGCGGSFRFRRGELDVVCFLLIRGGHAGGRLFQEREVNVACGRGIVEVVVAFRDQTVDDRARIFPFGAVLLNDLAALVGDLEVFAAAAVAHAAPIRGDVVLAFQPLQGAVQRRLFEHILILALFFDLADDLVAIFISVIKSAENDRIDMPADQVAVDGAAVALGPIFVVRIVQIHR